MTGRREKNLARRLATQPSQEPGEGAARSEAASTPGVVDLLAHLERRRTGAQVADDVDVFERYYAEHPDQEAFEVFDE